MTMRIVLDLSENDLKHFRKLAQRAMDASQKASPEQIIAGAHELLKEVEQSDASDFIRDKLNQIKGLTDMLKDEGWGLDEEGRKRVLTALAYFNQPEDLIPDHLPGIGFLDDAIMVELLSRELKPEIEAYADFVQYRETEAKRLGKEPSELNRGDFLDSRKQALHSRMRRRRRTGRSSGAHKSPFSLF